MDLKLLASHILSKTEIGKNLSFLPAKLNKLFQISESITIDKLLRFEESQIPNMTLTLSYFVSSTKTQSM